MAASEGSKLDQQAREWLEFHAPHRAKAKYPVLEWLLEASSDPDDRSSPAHPVLREGLVSEWEALLRKADLSPRQMQARLLQLLSQEQESLPSSRSQAAELSKDLLGELIEFQTPDWSE